VRIDLVRRTYQIDESPPRRVPDGLDVSMTAGSDHVRSPTEAAILFEPDGSSTGGRISLRGQGIKQTILTDWLSGRVTIETNR
jgi:general secretion pathway protein H